MLDLLLKAESEEEKKMMLNYLQKISKGFSTTVDHLAEIVDIQNQQKLRLEQISLYDYVEQTIDVLRAQIDASPSVIHNNVSRDLMLPANPAYLESILLNLLTNAIKYRQPDKALVVEIDAALKKSEFELVVSDNGQGINLEKYNNDVFGLYKTFHGNSDAKGVGLYITKLQVEAMNGRIELKSKEKEGTSFTIRFPTQVK